MLRTSAVDDEKLRQASDPTTPADALRALARGLDRHRGSRFRHASEETRALMMALVVNPATPFDVLDELTRYNPPALRKLPENPSFALHLLTNPGHLKAIVAHYLLPVASSPHAPPPLLAAGFEQAMTMTGGPDPLLVRTLLSHP